MGSQLRFWDSKLEKKSDLETLFYSFFKVRRVIKRDNSRSTATVISKFLTIDIDQIQHFRREINCFVREPGFESI